MILSYLGRLYLRVFGPRSLDKILSAFQRAHDELAALENHHHGHQQRIQSEMSNLNDQLLYRINERDRARIVRARLKDFLPH